MNRFERLNGRQRDVLRMIVSSHIEFAQPVSSRYVGRALGLSSATVRNVMMDLEDMGCISHPHTSAGRIPTDIGYREYVDNLMEPDKLTAEQEDFIHDFYHRKIEETFDSWMENALNALAMLTGQTGILFVPGPHLYIEGMRHMLDAPEFTDVTRLRLLFRTLEEKTRLLELLNNDIDRSGLNVHIGGENGCDELSDVTVINTVYTMDDSRKGLIGIIGPKRMSYHKLIPILEYTADMIEEIF